MNGARRDIQLQLKAHKQASAAWASALRSIAERVRTGALPVAGVGDALRRSFRVAADGVGFTFDADTEASFATFDQLAKDEPLPPYVAAKQIDSMADKISEAG